MSVVPASVSELVEAVKATRGPLLAVGAGTKPRLSAVDGVTRLSLSGLRGIVEYDPSESTFTALAAYGSGLRTGPSNNETVPQHLRVDATLQYAFEQLPLRPRVALDTRHMTIAPRRRRRSGAGS